jgi:hypothetical protein
VKKQSINQYQSHSHGLFAAVLVLVAVNSFLPQARAWDFQYTFWHVYSPNALDYIVGQENIQRSAEGNPDSGVSYWCPINNGQEARLTLKLTFPRPTAAIYVGDSYMASFNFGGGNYGSGSLWGSKNGVDWIQLIDAPTPSSVGMGYTYNSNLPDSLTGSSEIWLQGRLQSSGWNIMAQFLRRDTTDLSAPNVFELDANLVPVPEPSSALLALSGLALLVVQRSAKRG